jgi:hypothetical protein
MKKEIRKLNIVNVKDAPRRGQVFTLDGETFRVSRLWRNRAIYIGPPRDGRDHSRDL